MRFAFSEGVIDAELKRQLDQADEELLRFIKTGTRGDSVTPMAEMTRELGIREIRVHALKEAIEARELVKLLRRAVR